jgi:hypothetical protein
LELPDSGAKISAPVMSQRILLTGAASTASVARRRKYSDTLKRCCFALLRMRCASSSLTLKEMMVMSMTGITGETAKQEEFPLSVESITATFAPQ